MDNATLFPQEFTPEYFEQGYIGDCYLISTIDAISKFPELIKSFLKIQITLIFQLIILKCNMKTQKNSKN